MNTAHLMEIVRSEGLEIPVLYGVGRVYDECVVLDREASGWKVFVANERGGIEGKTLRSFTDESEAVEYLLLKLRQMTGYHRALAALG